MDTAWMIRNDGKAIPVIQHIYADVKEPEETLAAAEWLYQNTKNKSTKELVLESIALWGSSKVKAGEKDVVHGIMREIEAKPYRFLSKEFIRSVASGLKNTAFEGLDKNILYEEVKRELNQEFLRARYGGIYHTHSGSKDMVFRISSLCFNWYGIICAFLDRASFPIETITIIRDEESTGVIDGYYKTSLEEADCYRRLPYTVFQRERESFARKKENFTLKAEEEVNINQNIAKELGYGKSFRDVSESKRYF